jgi:NADPH2:quinone reductase
MVMFGEASGAPEPLDVTALTGFGSVTVSYPTGGHFNLTPAETRARAAEVLGWVKDGRLRLEWSVLPLAAAAEAHRLLEGRGTTGKLLLATTSAGEAVGGAMI